MVEFRVITDPAVARKREDASLDVALDSAKPIDEDNFESFREQVGP
jgi:hypothetical protein